MLRHVWSKQACAPSKKTVQSRSKLSVVVTASCEHQSHNALFILGVFTLLFCLLVVGFMQLGRGPSPYASCGWPALLTHNRRGLTFIKITLNLNPPPPLPHSHLSSMDGHLKAHTSRTKTSTCHSHCQQCQAQEPRSTPPPPPPPPTPLHVCATEPGDDIETYIR